MFRILIIPIWLLAAIQYSCVKDKPSSVVIQNPSTQPVVPAPASPSSGGSEKKYLALGDSYTIGQGVPVAECYPVQTKDWLLANGIGGISNPQIIATTGWTTFALKAAIAAANPVGPFDVVSLLIGVNDQYRGMDTAGYRIRFTELLLQSILLAGNLPSHVIVLSIPDYSVTPFARFSDTDKIRKEIDEFNEINKEVAIFYKTQYLDITPSTREAINNPDLVCADGLHPSGIEYKKWAARLGVLMKTVLQ